MTDDPRRTPKNRDYEVGYGKPPVSGRFVKGVSGNPRGRPKKDRRLRPLPDTSVRDSFLEEADRIIPVREGDKVLQMTVADAIRRAETIAALRGNTHAQKNFLEREARYKKERAEEIERDRVTWQRYVDLFGKPGAALPEGLPHPEDVIIEPGEPIRFRFGADPEKAEKHCQTLCRFRDAFLIQSEVDYRHHKDFRPRRHECRVPESLVIAIVANHALPRRHKYTDERFAEAQTVYMAMGRKALFDQRRARFRLLGLDNITDFTTRLVSKEEIETRIDAVKRKLGIE